MKAVLVLDIPDDIDISQVRIGGDGNIYYIRDGEKASIIGNIKNIKPLPKRHGDLIDRQALIDNGIKKGFCDWYDEIKMADTIIEADEKSEDNE